MRSSPTAKSSQGTKFLNITTASYGDDILSNIVPIPFSYDNGMLDIHIQNDVSAWIASGSEPFPYSYSMVKQMGGTGLVQSIGSNFGAYLSNWLSSSNSFGSNITNISVYQPAQVTRVQVPTAGFLGLNPLYQVLGQYSVVGITTTPPSGDDYISCGDSNDNYSSSWIFQTPLTLKFTVGGTEINYVTFTTTFTKNIPLSNFI